MRTYVLALAFILLSFARAGAQVPVPPQRDGAIVQSLEQQVAVLRERVRLLEERLAVLEAAQKKAAVAEKPPARVGQIIIVGNSRTPRDVILRQVPLFPGQVLSYPDLRVAEQNLERLNLFEVDHERGVRPTVTVLNPDGTGPYKDVLVTVREK